MMKDLIEFRNKNWSRWIDYAEENSLTNAEIFNEKVKKNE